MDQVIGHDGKAMSRSSEKQRQTSDEKQSAIGGAEVLRETIIIAGRNCRAFS